MVKLEGNTMLLQIGLLIIGFIFLTKGADFFVDGACSIASTFKIPTIIIGLTIVAFGTSAPEAAVSITAGFNQANSIAISNVIGSNIFNVLLVLGLVSIISIIPVPKSILRREFPLLLASSILMLVMSFTNYQVSRLEGLILLVIIIIYIVALIKEVSRDRHNIKVEEPHYSLSMSSFLTLIGLIGIIVGGDMVVNNAQKIALTIGISEKLVGLTIISIGTSLPELVTSITAARKNKADIAIGNIVGSNLFNTLFILGASSSLTAISVEPALLIDLLFMVVAVGLFYQFSRSKITFSKQEGIIFLSLFIVYLSYIIIRN